MALQTAGEPSRLERILAHAPDDPAGLARALEDSANWDALAREARGHGLFTLLVHECERAGRSVPATIREDYDRHHAIASVWHAHLMAALGALGEIFAEANERVVALKGPLLGERVYPEGALRPSVDLDLLVAEDDLERAVATLERAGWESDSGPTAVYARRHHHHLQLRREGQPPLELHFRARVAFGAVMPAADLVARSSAVTSTHGRGLRILAPEDELVYLAVHAAAHGFTRLMWLYDLKLHCRRYASEIDWRVVVERARRVRMLTAVAFACEMLRERLNVAVPDLPELRPHGLRYRLAQQVQQRVARHEGVLALDRAGGLAFTSLLCDRPIAAARVWGHHASHMLKRRVQRRLPRLVPADWAG
jgi:Uncharacterised nucleotidyltransferase